MTAVQTLAEIDTELAALPDEDDIGAPNERIRVWDKRQALTRRRMALMNLLDRVNSIGPRFEPLREWRDALNAVRVEFERELAEIEDQPSSRRTEALRESLRILQNGPNHLGGPEFVPEILYAALARRGARPEQGRMFNGRGGLRRVEARLAALDAEQDDARSQLEVALL